MMLIITSVIFKLGVIAAYSVITLQPANFTWLIESVLKVNDEGKVSEERYSFSFDIKEIYYEEFQDSLAYLDRGLRIIRDVYGYYLITDARFKNVCIFRAYYSAIVLNNKIFILEFSVQNPAFNQRASQKEIIDGEKTLKLTHQGIEVR